MLNTLELHNSLKVIANLPDEKRLAEFYALKNQVNSNDLTFALNESIIHECSDDKSEITYGSILAYALRHGNNDGLLAFVKALIQSGAKTNGIHLTTGKIDNPDKLSLIHVCAQVGALAFFEHLVIHEKQPITTLTNQGNSMLDFLPQDKEHWLRFIAFLDNHKRFDELCLTNHNTTANIFNKLLQEKKNVEIAYQLYQKAPKAYQQCVIDYKALQTLANHILTDPPLYHFFRDTLTLKDYTEMINETIRSVYQQRRDNFENHTIPFPVKDYLKPSTKSGMIQAIDDYVNQLLRNPTNLKILLSQLDQKLKNALELSGMIDKFNNASREYRIQNVHRYDFPIPTENYQKICKQSTLERVLLNILKSADMGHRSRKWFGLIPHDKANEMISSGDFFIESQFGTGVLHGKFSHMIQWVLLILGIEQGFIRTQPGITAKSIIHHLVNHKTAEHKDNAYLYAIIIDAQYNLDFTFQDPFRLCSLITTGYFGEACRTLEVYLRDSFCSGYIQWLDAFNAELPTPITREEFSILLNHTQTNIFPKADFAKQAHLNHISTKNNPQHTHKIGFFTSFERPEKAYATIEKNYFSEKKYASSHK